MNATLCALLAASLWGLATAASGDKDIDAGVAWRARMQAQSDIVFLGTVQRHHGASFPGVRATANTLVVRVDLLLDKPKAIAIRDGDLVTVATRAPSLFRDGERAVFYSEGWVFGQGVAVREINHEAGPALLDEAGRRLVSDRFEAAKAQLALTRLRARARAVDLIVAGEVVAVRPVRPAVGAEGEWAEHDPQWQEAEIRVLSVIKGAVPGNRTTVTLRFARSHDGVWAEMPKFTSGQQGTFLLQHADTHGTMPATFMASTADDSLPINAAHNVAAALQR